MQLYNEIIIMKITKLEMKAGRYSQQELHCAKSHRQKSTRTHLKPESLCVICQASILNNRDSTVSLSLSLLSISLLVLAGISADEVEHG